MFIRLLLALTLITAIVFVVRHIRKQPAEKRPKLITIYTLYLVVIILISLAITGKIDWITAGIASLFPIAQKLFPLLFRALPFINFIRQKKAKKPYSRADDNSRTGGNSEAMTVKKAKEIFGITSIHAREQIIQRHRELIQKNHPDRGGSDYLAAQINQARDILLDHIAHT